MRIAIASDHAAFDLKAELRDYLIELGHEVADLGPETADRVDYPDFGYKLADVVADGTAEFGVALCGSGIGISIAVNRHPKLRCALVSEPYSATLARERLAPTWPKPASTHSWPLNFRTVATPAALTN